MVGTCRIVLFFEIINLFVCFNLGSPRTENEFVEIEIPELGKIRGKVGKSFFTKRPIYHFLGISYAKPPSKERRFKPPEKFESWRSLGTYDATKMRQNCPQVSTSYYPPLDPDQLDVKEDVEDCLVVNVFAPENNHKNVSFFPVMYYIHGGSFYAGSAYDFFPDFLLEEDIILVVVQYRLGILGFLSLDTDEIPGNLGMLDIVMGLNWVKDNIHAFGGNASDITVVGQSAGAAAASSLLISPLVPEGLFQKMIIQSGSALSSWALDEEPVKSALAMAKILECETENIKEVVQCFKNATVKDLINAHAKFETKDIARCGTSLVIQRAGDQKFLVEHPRATYSKGKFLKIPMMGGTTREEGSSFVAGFYYGHGLDKRKDGKYYERNVTRDVLRFCGGFRDNIEIMADYLHNLYFKNKKTSSFKDVAPGLVDICGVLLLKGSTYENLRFVSLYVPTFSYSFNFFGNVSKLRASDPAWNRNEPLPAGVGHSDELGYLFPSYRFNYTWRELKMVKKMTALWTNFVKKGTPSNVQSWPPVSTLYGPYLRISDKNEIHQNIFDEFVVTSTEGFLGNSAAVFKVREAMMSAEDFFVKTSQGSLRGRKVPSVRRGFYFSFQGIPYAKPPVGNLRFKAPVAVESWTGVRDATKPGPVAPSFSLVTREYEENSSEDCLFLNVYTKKIPDSESEPLQAVMFWIHGGGFYSGSGNPDFYSPDYLVTENVVIVTCNYRLGPLGFISLQNSKCPGNNGLKDLILALKWCQKNISAFGGDPKNVTIFGESAGGAAVHYLTLIKKTEGLFHKAIVQSGVAINPWAIAMNPRECAFKLGEVLGCKTDDDKKLLEFLRNVRAEDLMTKSKHVLKAVYPREFYFENAFVPCIEPETEEALMTKHPEDIYNLGEMRKIPFMIGANTLEGLIMIKRGERIPELKTDKEMERLIPRSLNVQSGSKLAQNIVEKIRGFYFSKGFDEENCVNALSRIYFLNGINRIIDYHCNFSLDSSPTYVYKFTYNGNVFSIKHFLGFEHWKGTCHGDELIYLFKQTLFNVTLPEGTEDYAMMKTLTKLWTDFAKTGCPVPEKSNSWAFISKNSTPYMEIDKVLTQKSDFEKKEYEFWKEIQKMASQNQSNSKL